MVSTIVSWPVTALVSSLVRPPVMPDREHEIYPYPPVEVVAFELRIPHALGLADRAAQTRVWQTLKERLPITQPQQGGLQVTIGGPMMHSQPLRMLDRGRTESVVIGPEAIVVENTSYRCYEDFCALLSEVLQAVSGEQIAGFTRIGLRYINEIRVAGTTTPQQWEGLIDASLLAGASLVADGMTVSRLGGEIEYETGTDHTVVLRYGSFEGRLVNLEGPLGTRTQESGPAFLIDLDSYWENPVQSPLPPFSIEEIMKTTSELREPIHQLFEVVISQRLRDIFREETA